ncbi:isochorismatase family protein [Kluyvera intermedia]|uniref:cysteine hydrolase family protein n=1 Tax=Kluyvera intermedia TaxID=61648 RepID=UPI0007883F15|nr:isochorismatase family protein [Kluyvera intermedia]WQD28089.1 isochorismatase family protein [Kluyvera intermedia]VDZ83640.1 Isochorismatase family [Kluyvera intermedia]
MKEKSFNMKHRREDFQILFCDIHEALLAQSQTVSLSALRTNIEILHHLGRHFGLPHHFLTVPVQGKPGKLIDELLRFQTESNTHYRYVADPFLTPDFESRLRVNVRRTLIICGFSAEVGVYFTAISAVHSGFRVIIPVDCIGSRSLRTESVALRQLESAGVEIISLSTLAALMEPDFSTEAGQFVLKQMSCIKY